MWTDVCMSGLVGVALKGWAVNDTRPARPLNEWCLLKTAQMKPDAGGRVSSASSSADWLRNGSRYHQH
jgi:hypothetical protein